MNKVDSTENRFDSNMGSIFGEFQLPGSLTLEEQQVNNDDPEVVQTLPTEVIKDIVGEDTPEDTEDNISEDVENDSVIENESEDNSTEDIEYSYKAIANYLAEQGIIDFEDSDDIEDNPDILENVVLQTAKNMVQEYKDSIPEDAKQFLNYIEKGGDPSKYLQALSKPIDFDSLDLTSEDNQKLVLREFLATQDYTREEIEDELKDYEDALILEKKAQVASKKLEKIYSKQKEQILAQQEAEIENRRKQYDEYVANIKTTINNASNLAGLNIGPNDKKEFEKYLLGRDKEGLTQYEREVQENPIQTQIELAYLKFKKFDFSKVANKAKTEETRRIKNLIKTKDITPKGQSKKIEQDKGSDLSAFRSIVY